MNNCPATGNTRQMATLSLEELTNARQELINDIMTNVPCCGCGTLECGNPAKVIALLGEWIKHYEN